MKKTLRLVGLTVASPDTAWRVQSISISPKKDGRVELQGNDI